MDFGSEGQHRRLARRVERHTDYKLVEERRRVAEVGRDCSWVWIVVVLLIEARNLRMCCEEGRLV